MDRSLVGYSPWGGKELNMTEYALQLKLFSFTIHGQSLEEHYSLHETIATIFSYNLGK